MIPILTLCACWIPCAHADSGNATDVEPQLLAVPAASPARGPRISGNDASGLYLTWMEPGADSTTLRYATYLDGAWSSARSIANVEKMFVNWADMPSVLPVGNGHLAAHWLQKSADLTYAYDVMYTRSTDNGATWSEPVRPHTDGTPTEHGFVSMFRHGDSTGLVWLDGRKTANEDSSDPLERGMTLRTAFIDQDMTLHGEHQIDALTCDCCQTDVAITSSGPVVVYRDRTVDEIRDIYVTRLVAGQWLPGQAVSDDHWEISGCPVNGPSIAAADETVVVAWFTAADDHPVVKLSWSRDGGENFAAPIEVTKGSTLGRAGAVLLNDGDAAVSWLQPGDNHAYSVNLRRVGARGQLGPVRTISKTADAFAVPQLAKFGDDLIVVWTAQQNSEYSVASARIPWAGL